MQFSSINYRYASVNKPQFSGRFIPAKYLAGAEDMTSQMGVTANYNGDLTIANFVNQSLDLVKTKVGRLPDKLKVLVDELPFKGHDPVLFPASYTTPMSTFMAGLEPLTLYLNPNTPWGEMGNIMKKLRAHNVASTDHKLHPIVHELGHAFFREQLPMGVPPFKQLYEFANLPMPKNLKKTIEDEIGLYATDEPEEFVCEVFPLKLLGGNRRLSDSVENLYRMLGGPSVKKS
jgi:hypothetical protein